MTNFIADLIIFAGGMLTMGFVMLPKYLSAWAEGYKEAEKIYDNWDRGFSQGYEAGIKEVLDILTQKGVIEDYEVMAQRPDPTATR